MANHKDAAKRAVQAVKRRARNRSNRTEMRNKLKVVRAAFEGTDKDAMTAEFRATVSVIQRLAAKGVIHKNQAARRVQRLAKALKAKTT